MSAKSKTSPRAATLVRGKSIKKPRSGKAKAVAKARVHAHSVGKLPAIKTRTSLIGAKIYPASVEPSKRAKQIIAALADPSVAA
jgi:hypothetical protein